VRSNSAPHRDGREAINNLARPRAGANVRPQIRCAFRDKHASSIQISGASIPNRATKVTPL